MRRTSSPRLTGVDGRKVATGRFADDGTLTNPKADQLDEPAAAGIAAALRTAEVRVSEVSRSRTRATERPFTTSTLQQEASRKLRLNSRNAARRAPLRGNYITYMRTDSTTLSDAAWPPLASRPASSMGATTSPTRRAGTRRRSRTRRRRTRPSAAGDRDGTLRRWPASSAVEFALYELIWKRTIASQMADARGSTASVRLGATLGEGPAPDRAVGDSTVITFRGFLAAYEEGRDERQAARRKDEAEEASPAAPRRGAHRAHGGRRARDLAPPRYTEATLVKAMEERGIGHPSTYASTIGTSRTVAT